MVAEVSRGVVGPVIELLNAELHALTRGGGDRGTAVDDRADGTDGHPRESGDVLDRGLALQSKAPNQSGSVARVRHGVARCSAMSTIKKDPTPIPVSSNIAP